MKAQWRALFGILLMCVLGAGCDSEDAASPPPPLRPAEWAPDSPDFALTYDAACDEPCEHFDGSYTVIYRDDRPTAGRRIGQGGRAADEVSRAEVHFLPGPLELIELTESTGNLDGPDLVRRWSVPRTVEDLFEVIEKRIIAERADYFTLAFGEFGVPLRFSGDVATSIDEEFSYGSIQVEEIP